MKVGKFAHKTLANGGETTYEVRILKNDKIVYYIMTNGTYDKNDTHISFKIECVDGALNPQKVTIETSCKHNMNMLNNKNIFYEIEEDGEQSCTYYNQELKPTESQSTESQSTKCNASLLENGKFLSPQGVHILPVNLQKGQFVGERKVLCNSGYANNDTHTQMTTVSCNEGNYNHNTCELYANNHIDYKLKAIISAIYSAVYLTCMLFSAIISKNSSLVPKKKETETGEKSDDSDESEQS